MNMKKSISFQTTLGRVRALGSAKSGTHEWYLMRLTSVALLLLTIYPIFGFFIYAVYGGRAGAIEWLRTPIATTGVILFLGVGFHHGAAGLQTVIEDYFHCACVKNTLLFIVKFAAAIFAILGILTTLKIALGV